MTDLLPVFRPPSVLQSAERSLASRLTTLGFIASGPVSDRHGALQLTFVAARAEVITYIIFAEALGSKEDGYRGSIDVVFEASGEHLLKRRVYATTKRSDFERDLHVQLGHAVRATSTMTAEVVGIDPFVPLAGGLWNGTISPEWKAGRVKWIDNSRGFGFIGVNDGRDVMFQCAPDRVKSLGLNADVEFGIPTDHPNKVVIRPSRGQQH